MAELRWILLLAGVVFLCALATWELRRAQRAQRAAGTEPDERMAERGASAERAGSAGTGRREPTLDLSLEPGGEGGEGDGQDGAPHAVSPQPMTEPMPPSAHHDVDAMDAMDEARATQAADPMQAEPDVSATLGAEPAIAVTGATPIEASPPLRVEWPDERERRILSLRIVAGAGERLSGRAVRQALGACGFVHGPYRIYHQPGADGRALLSCANLTKPGDFDPLTLDFQRLTGLSLFALLPGPMPPSTALEHLLATADELAQRLQAELSDERGAPLGEGRIAALRSMVQQWMEDGEPQSPGRPAANGRAGAERAREA